MRALVTHPRPILMDPPFAALGEIARFRPDNELLPPRDKIGCMVIFVTHPVFESVFLSDRFLGTAARPGRVILKSAVDAPCPRDDDFRASAGYAAPERVDEHELRRARRRRMDRTGEWPLPVVAMALELLLRDRLVGWNGIPHSVLRGRGWCFRR